MNSMLNRAVDAYWAPRLSSETIRSPKRMVSALYALFPPDPLRAPSANWGNALQHFVRLFTVPVVLLWVIIAWINSYKTVSNK
jgi:hypothetical protein